MFVFLVAACAAKRHAKSPMTAIGEGGGGSAVTVIR